jgi:hypothetical protein
MKKYLTFLFLVSVFNAFGQKNIKPHYRKLKTIYTDLNNDGKPDTIILSSSLTGEAFFNKITINIPGLKSRTFVAKDSWTTVDKWFLDSNKNTVKTELIFLKKTEKQSVILLFGELDAAGERGEFSIINIENNNIKMVFDDDGKIDVDYPTKLISLKNDARLTFIYRNINEFDEQVKNAMIGSYAPFFVYIVNDSCKLDKPLMKRYNEEHYVFAGYQYSEKIRIRYPTNGGKPSIWKKRRLE